MIMIQRALRYMFTMDVLKLWVTTISVIPQDLQAVVQLSRQTACFICT